jgi:3-oxoacyl-[acyl-carrier-protein] synthase III
MYHSKIAGLGYFVPSNVVTNDDRNVSTPMTSGFRKELELGKKTHYTGRRYHYLNGE